MSSRRADRPLAAFEATSFLNKFKNLWHAGHQATLSFETEAGQAWATLRVRLGDHPLDYQNARHVKPYQECRRERRADARAAEEVANASHLSPSNIAEKAVEKSEPKKTNGTVEEAAAAETRS